MEKLIKFLKENKIEQDIGIIKDNYFYKIVKPFKDKQVISFKWKKNATNKLILKLEKKGIILIENVIGKYNALYNIKETKNQVFIVYAVDSHVQLPKTLLKNFRTGDYLYFIDTTKNKIFKSSAKNYNTEFGYYSLFFEDYLNNNYEKIITEIIEKSLLFIENKEQSVSFKNWNENINKLFFMSIFRNPKQIKNINKNSAFSQLFDKGYEPEYIAYFGEEMKNNFIKGYKAIPIVNKTEKNIITLKSLVANLFIDGGVEAMVMSLHPKFAIALVPNQYYDEMVKEQGQQTYMLMNNESEIKKLNKQIYNTAKFHNEDVIGIKEDLEELQNSIKQSNNLTKI